MIHFDFSADHILDNDFVLLRPLRMEDHKHLLEYSLNEPELWRFNLGGAAGSENLENYIRNALALRQQEREYPFIVYDKLSNKYVGCTRFYDIDLKKKFMHIGYTWYGKNYQGTHINKNCKYLLLEFAFDTLGMERVGLGANALNQRSIRAMKGIGARLEGLLQSASAGAESERIDVAVLGITKDEWLANVKKDLARKATRSVKYQYRKGTIADMQQVRELNLQAYMQFRDIVTPENWAKMETTLSSTETYTRLFSVAQCFVCELGDSIIGTAFLVPSGNPNELFQDDWAYIRLVGVQPGFEGQGIGRRLTQMCIDHARDIGEKYLTLHTSDMQEAARHVYEKLGFNIHREFVLYGRQYFIYMLQLDAQDITFHLATLEDVQTLVDLRTEFALELSAPPGRGTTDSISEQAISNLKQHFHSYFTEATLMNTCISFIAKCGDEIAGIGSMTLREQPGNFRNPLGRLGYIMNMYTVPEFRKRGVCRGILKALINEARRRGYNTFELHATEQGEPVYVKSGFEKHHEPTYRLYHISLPS